MIDTVREAANIKQDFRILSLLECHELVAAKAHYHKSLYKTYTRQKPDYRRVDDNYSDEEYHNIVKHAYTPNCSTTFRVK